jgi:hypothetical protein
MGTLMTRLDDTRTNLQNRSAELLTQTRKASTSLLTQARDEARDWRSYLLGRRFALQRELRALSTPAALEQRALELTAEGLAAAKARIDTRLIELAAMQAAKKRVQAKKARPSKRAAAKKPAAPIAKPRVAAKKSATTAAKTRGSKRLEFPAPN